MSVLVLGDEFLHFLAGVGEINGDDPVTRCVLVRPENQL